MGVTVRVLTNQADSLQNGADLFLNDRLIPLALDDQALSDDIADGHTGVQRGDGVLEDHLDAGDQLALLCHAELVFVLFLELLQLFGIALGILELSGILALQLLYQRSGVLLVYRLVVDLSGTDLLSVFFQNGIVVFLGDLLFLQILLSLLDGILVGPDTCADTLAFEVDIAGGNIVQLDDRAAGGGLAAAGLANQTEGLALLDLEAYIVNCLQILAAHAEVLAKMVYF